MGARQVFSTGQPEPPDHQQHEQRSGQIDPQLAHQPPSPPRRTRRSRLALLTTVTDDSAMAALAKTGLSSQPVLEAGGVFPKGLLDSLTRTRRW